MSIETPEISIVVPVHNEEANVEHLAEGVHKVLSPQGITYNIILVDDGSSDESWKRIKDLSTNHTQVSGIKLSRNFGKEAALSAGLRIAQGTYTITMDCDLQHPPMMIWEMYQLASNQNFEVVDAVKEQRQTESGLHRLCAKTFYILFRKLSGVDIYNSTDLRLLSKKAKAAYLTMNESTHFYRGMTTWIGFKRAQVFFSPPQRLNGKSSWSFFKLLKMGIRALTSYSSAPLQIVTILGIIFAFFAILLGAWSFYMYLSHKSLPGFTTVILLQLFIGTVSMFGLGIMGEYIARIYDEVKKRPVYLIEEKTESPFN